MKKVVILAFCITGSLLARGGGFGPSFGGSLVGSMVGSAMFSGMAQPQTVVVQQPMPQYSRPAPYAYSREAELDRREAELNARERALYSGR